MNNVMQLKANNAADKQVESVPGTHWAQASTARRKMAREQQTAAAAV